MHARLGGILLLFVAMTTLFAAPARTQFRTADAPTTFDGTGLAPLWRDAAARGPHASALAVAPLSSLLPTTSSIPEDAAWEQFSTPGPMGNSYEIADWQGKLVLVGNVWAAGHTPCPGIAVWNGTTFEQLPSPGGNPQLLTVWNDQIVVAIQSSSGQWPIMRYNGATWDTLGVPNNFPTALSTFAGKLVVGGRFTAVSGVAANRIAAYDGSTWTAFGTGFTGASDEVDYMVDHAGKLIAAGKILGGKQIGAWNSALGTWDVLGQGLTGSISALTSDGVSLFVTGGSLSSAGTTPSAIVRWDGGAWSAVPGTAGKSGLGATMWNGHLLAIVPQPPYGSLSQWDGVTLSAVPGDSLTFLSGGANHIGTLGTRLVVTGNFRGNGSVIMPSVAIYDGAQWTTPSVPWDALMLGPQNSLIGLGTWNGKLLAAAFSAPFAQGDHWQIVTSGLATFDGSKWEPLGSNAVFGQYKFFETWNGDLIVAGYGISVSGTTIQGVARWDGSAWHDMAGNTMTQTNAVRVFHGDLFLADGPTGVARWNGTAWVDLGSGLAGPPFSSPVAFTLGVHGDSLIAGGEFITAGGLSANNIAAWDGAAWHALGAGFDGGSVDAVGSWNGLIIAGGGFTSSGGQPMVGAAYWDGSTWHQMGSKAAALNYIEDVDGDLVASGRFQLPTGGVATTLARWNGSDWDVLGTGGGSDIFESSGGYIYLMGYGTVNGHATHGLSRVPLSAVLDAPRPQASAHIALAVSPNPARVRASFSFTLPAAGQARVTVLDLAGRRVATLADGALAAGPHHSEWATPGAPGVYLALLETAAGRMSRRFVVLQK